MAVYRQIPRSTWKNGQQIVYQVHFQAYATDVKAICGKAKTPEADMFLTTGLKEDTTCGNCIRILRKRKE